MNIITLILLVMLFAGCNSKPSLPEGQPTVIGAMKNVMMKGELAATIDLDTIANRAHLYGLGPVEYLAGELLIMDGRAFKSTVASDSTMIVEETFAAKAPFFGYARIESWVEYELPEEITTIKELEDYLGEVFPEGPSFFRLQGMIDGAIIHVVNLPEGSSVSSPEDAHVGQVNYELGNEQVDIVGFYSTQHQAIFTHHDSFLHMHLITEDRKKMGHLDKIQFKSMKLYLPQ